MDGLKPMSHHENTRNHVPLFYLSPGTFLNSTLWYNCYNKWFLAWWSTANSLINKRIKRNKILRTWFWKGNVLTSCKILGSTYPCKDWIGDAKEFKHLTQHAFFLKWKIRKVAHKTSNKIAEHLRYRVVGELSMGLL